MALVVQITGDTSGLDSALGKSTGGINAFGQTINLGGVVKMAAFAGAAGIAVAAVAELTMAAAADRDEQVALANTIANATGSTEDYTAAVEAAIDAGQRRAFSDSETRDALGTLVTATRDVGAATQGLTLAQDVARQADVDLATAADAVAKAQQGNGRALAALLPGLTASKDATDILAAAQTASAGAADTFAESSEGQMMRTSDAMGELGETIGSVFLPILDEILPALLPIIEALGEMIEAILPVLIPLVRQAATMLGILADVVKEVAGFVGGLVTTVEQAIDAIGALIDEINIIPDVGGIIGDVGDFINPFGAPAPTPEGASAGTRAAGAGSSGGRAGGVTINIMGDPATVERSVVRALRTYGRRTGRRFVTDLGVATG